ncbi:hypothetical protein QBC34DRAFT_392002 [Podospora aff. communis PSN243]|uniref:Uncharacterized protein n=1 Tax=Podospora aff. communis PSN243 TaxID=3040156 RepID=A0AAV9H3L7_9PEZI|nr:hypothetical protein QBC34DRAFT_392002 [Podospora aff. communis PSN243]
MAPPGSYQDLIRDLGQCEPRLRRPDKRWSRNGPVRVLALEIPKPNPSRPFAVSQETLRDADELRQYLGLRQSKQTTDHLKTIYIIEGLNQATIEIIGTHFNMHPSIFLDYIRSAQISGDRKGRSSMLASSWATRDHLVMAYRELLGVDVDAAELRCSRTTRNIARTRVNGNLDHVGILQRRAVIWSKQRESQPGWDCIVICDPPAETATADNTKRPDGYVDFVPIPIQYSTRLGPPRTCLADDLAFYLTTHFHLVDAIQSPSAVTFFALKIIASHYTQVLDYFRRNLREVQRFMRGPGPSDLGRSHLSLVEANWVDVQFIERRLDKGRVDLEEILLQTGASLDPPDSTAITSWKDVSADFRLLYHRLIYLQQSAERINASITGLASIVGNRQAFREQQLSLHAAEKSRGLTFIGLVFIPLAFVASLFSMSEPYGPGGDQFWLYFAISVPVGLIVMAAYYIFDLGFRADGSGWSFSRIVEVWKDATSRRQSQSTSSRSMLQRLDKDGYGINIE